MELTRYLRVLRRWLWLLLACPVIAAFTAAGVSVWLPPVYEAQVSLLVRPAQPLAVDAGGASLTSDQISRTYARLMTERPLLETVVADLGLQTSAESLVGTIKVTPEPNTTILDVAVQDTNPQVARDVANKLVEDFIIEVKRIQQQEQATPNARSADSLVVVSPAVTPSRPVSPNIPLNILLATVAGLLVGLGVAFLLEYLDQSISADEELVDKVGLVAVGHIPYVQAGRNRRAEVVALAGDSAVVEAYKALRTNLIFSTFDQLVKTIVVTSASAGEGKTRTASNLAVVLAQAGHRTLLVDADLRRPSLQRVFGRVRNVGLSNFFVRDVPEEQLVTAVEDVPNLWLVLSGPTPPNPSELLGSARMKDILGRLREAFTYVIIDAPPVNAVTDASILAAAADANLIVVEHGKTTYPALKRARQSLDRVGGHTLGAVFNKVRASEAYYGSYAYGSYKRPGNSDQAPSNGETLKTAEAQGRKSR